MPSTDARFSHSPDIELRDISLAQPPDNDDDDIILLEYEDICIQSPEERRRLEEEIVVKVEEDEVGAAEVAFDLLPSFDANRLGTHGACAKGKAYIEG